MNTKTVISFVLGLSLIVVGAVGCIENDVYFGSSYLSTSINVGNIEIEEVINNADYEGYSVEKNVVYKGGLQPAYSIEKLDDKLGRTYNMTTVDYIYDDRGLRVSINDMPEGKTSAELTFMESDAYPLIKEVPWKWITQMFMISFNLNEQDAQNYIETLKYDFRAENENDDEPLVAWVENDSTIESKVAKVSVWVNEVPDLNSMYEYLNNSSTNSDLHCNYPGSFEQDFFNNDKKIGSIDYTIPLITVTKIERQHAYLLNIDAKGNVNANIKLKEPDTQIQESEYDVVLKEMFVGLGLNPEYVDQFEFEYIPY